MTESIEETMLRDTMAEGREHPETVVLPRERYQNLLNTAAALETSANECRMLRAECEALRLADNQKVGTLDGILNEFLSQAVINTIKSQQFQNRIHEELEKAVDRFLEGKEFEKQIDSAVKDYLENTHIEVDEAVEAAIKESLEVVKISFQGH